MLVFGGSLADPNHDAVMRIGSEAPRRRTHSFGRHQSHADERDPPPRTVPRPVASVPTGRKLGGVACCARSSDILIPSAWMRRSDQAAGIHSAGWCDGGLAD